MGDEKLETPPILPNKFIAKCLLMGARERLLNGLHSLLCIIHKVMKLNENIADGCNSSATNKRLEKVVFPTLDIDLHDGDVSRRVF